jgi:hypothetical protein
MDLAGAYPGLRSSTWRRTARLDREQRCVRVVDAWDLPPGAVSTSIQLIIAGEVSCSPGRAVVQALDDAGVLELTWDPATAPVVTERLLDDPVLTAVWGARLTRLSIPVGGRTGRLELRAWGTP